MSIKREEKLGVILNVGNRKKIAKAKKIFPEYEESYLVKLLFPKVDRLKYMVSKLTQVKTLDEFETGLDNIRYIFNDNECVSENQLEEILSKIIDRTTDLAELAKLLDYCVCEYEFYLLANRCLKKMNPSRVFNTDDITTFFNVFSAPNICFDSGKWFILEIPEWKACYSDCVRDRAEAIFALRPKGSYSPYELHRYYVLTMGYAEFRTYRRFGIYQHESYANSLGKACLNALPSTRSTEDILNLIAFSVYDNIREYSCTVAVKIIDKVLGMKMSKADMLKVLNMYTAVHKDSRGWDEKRAEKLMVKILKSR